MKLAVIWCSHGTELSRVNAEDEEHAARLLRIMVDRFKVYAGDTFKVIEAEKEDT